VPAFRFLRQQIRIGRIPRPAGDVDRTRSGKSGAVVDAKLRAAGGPELRGADLPSGGAAKLFEVVVTHTGKHRGAFSRCVVDQRIRRAGIVFETVVVGRHDRADVLGLDVDAGDDGDRGGRVPVVLPVDDVAGVAAVVIGIPRISNRRRHRQVGVFLLHPAVGQA